MRLFVGCGLVLASGIASAQFLLVPDSGNDRILKLDAQTGAVIDANFIVNAAFSTPVAAKQVGAEIWITDQINDSIYRYSDSGSLLSTITGQLDNVRGLNVVNGQVWVTNAGTANGGAIGIYRYDFSGNLLGNFALGASSGSNSPWDIKQFGSDVYISDSTSDDIDRYDVSGTYLGKFYNSPGSADLNFPQQIGTFNNQVMVAGFSIPTGLYRFDSSGAKVGTYDVSGSLGLRGVYQLGNGNILATGGTRLVLINTSGPVWTDSNLINQLTPAASFRFIHEFTPVPEPGTLAVLGLGCAAMLRRKQKVKKSL
ncbi:MAG: PEP-CTERM sorting domain-containing protein [Armatimonadota bacterium]